jgi:hypothetical protein
MVSPHRRRAVFGKGAVTAAQSGLIGAHRRNHSSLDLLESLGGSRRAASPVQRAIKLVELVGPGRRGMVPMAESARVGDSLPARDEARGNRQPRVETGGPR